MVGLSPDASIELPHSSVIGSATDTRSFDKDLHTTTKVGVVYSGQALSASQAQQQQQQRFVG